MDDYVKTVITGNESEAADSLEKFIEAAAQVFEFPELNCDDLRKNLWEALLKLAKTTKDENVLKNCFIAIRILSREKTELDKLINEDWLELIKIHSGLNDSNYSFSDKQLSVLIEVQKCLCNLIYNSPIATNICCSNGILELLTERLQTYTVKPVPADVQFFDVKLLFLLTALNSQIRGKVKNELDGVTSLIKLLDLILKEAADLASPDKIKLDDEKTGIVCEILKALFNITLYDYGDHDDVEENSQCEHLVSVLRVYLLMPTSNKEKSSALKNNIINLLTNIPNKYYSNLITQVAPGQNIPLKFQYNGENMTPFYEMLMFLKAQLEEEHGKTRQYELLSPVFTVLLKAATGARSIRKYLRLQILPPLKDVHNRPEQGTTLRNYLCRLLTTPITQLRDMVADLLFILCKKSVKRMIKYTGYGNAAGLFAQRGLLGGRSDKGEAEFSSGTEGSETEEYAEFKHGINPVTGVYEEPHASPMENMTEEQKEYEALKLVNLIDSLTKCGAIQPCRVGPDGRPQPIKHVLELQELKGQLVHNKSDSDTE